MTANSITGSFRGIEVSFSLNGPHIIMSVLNKAENGRRLRVMYQQQPLGGRVNWLSFQLSKQHQNVVVPSDVIQSHRLAFYVDSHEPISTYTSKILDELNQIKVQQDPESKENDSIPELENDTQQQSDKPFPEEVLANSNGNGNHLDHEHSIADNLLDVDTVTDIATDIDDTDKSGSLENQNTETNNTNSEFENIGPNYLEKTNRKTKADIKTVHRDITDTKALENGTKEKSITEDSESIESLTSKRTTQYIGQYIPSVTDDIRFNIKVPSFPKSASKANASFIPQNSSNHRLNGKKHSVFGQLAGVFGISPSKSKKAFYQEQNHTIYEKFHAKLESMEDDYNSGYGISLENWDFDSISEQETAVLVLNLMVNEVKAWKKSAMQGTNTKKTLATNLEEIEEELKQTLKQTRGMTAPSPTLFPDRIATSEQDLMDIQKDCDVYLNRFTEKLSTLEQKHAEKVKLSAFKRFLVEFVRDKLFPNVVEFSSLSSVQPRLNWFLDLVDCELIPIEPGKTKISDELHKVTEIRNSDCEPDTIVEVIKPGLQSKDGKRVIHTAVVVQAE